MEKTITVEAFIKAVDKEYFDLFLNEGEICMNTQKVFKEYESKNDAIGDKYEGAIHAISKGATISIAPLGKYDEFKILAKDVEDVLFFNDQENGNILSLYTISDEKEIHIIPRKFLNEFNNHRFCLITAPNLFLEKVNAEIINRGFTPKAKSIYYFVPDANPRPLNPFLKRIKYAYQNESRVFFNNPRNKCVILKIGSIREFAFEIFLNNYMYKISNNAGKDLIITAE